jgi:hypothetical protein
LTVALIDSQIGVVYSLGQDFFTGGVVKLIVHAG